MMKMGITVKKYKGYTNVYKAWDLVSYEFTYIY